MPDEMFDIIDEEDNVIDQEMRSVVHKRGLWHRGVHVFLSTAEGKLLVQQRSKDRVHSPLALDCSVSEHVKAGEDYFSAAVRGLKEEMGVEGIDLEQLVKFKMNYGPNDNEVSELYRGIVDPDVVKFDPVEIEQIDYYSLDELQEMLIGSRRHPRRRGRRLEQLQESYSFSYWFEQILQWYLGKPSALEVLKIYASPK